MAERTGTVSNIGAPKEGKKMWSAQVGGKWVRFYGTEYGSDDPSAVLVALRDAENRGLTVKVVGDEVALQGSKWPMFKITDVEFTNGQASGAPAQTFQPDNRDRSIQAQVAYKIAGGLAASGAIPAEALSTHAGYIFYGIQELAEGKATGNDADQGSQWAP